MLQRFPSFLDVSRSLAGRMRDEAGRQQARRAVGCLDVATCADLVDPGRVNIFERWESQAALETFRSRGPDTEQRPAILTVSVQEYDIVDAGRVRGGCGMNRPDGLCCDR
jgi:quinol monooxygenase YgiN